jgi:hypothetical protein
MITDKQKFGLRMEYSVSEILARIGCTVISTLDISNPVDAYIVNSVTGELTRVHIKSARLGRYQAKHHATAKPSFSFNLSNLDIQPSDVVILVCYISHIHRYHFIIPGDQISCKFIRLLSYPANYTGRFSRYLERWSILDANA